jgi:uncharacterized iron-regulated membrane protein
MRMNWWKWHKWLALVVGLQVLAWASSGLFMSVVPIEKVRSEHLMREAAMPDLRAVAAGTAPLAVVLAAVNGPVDGLELTQVDDRAVWRVQQGKAFTLVEADSGVVLSPLAAAAAQRIAMADYAGKGGVQSATLLKVEPPIEYRGPLPVWQVTFNDPEGLRVYVSPTTGKVVARRNNTWRVYDFLWSLHIMDYREHEDFNHPLLIAFAAGLLVLTLTGVVLLYRRFKPISRNLSSR